MEKNADREAYLSNCKPKRIFKILSKHPDYVFYKAVSIHRKYRKAKENHNIFLSYIYGMKANRLASKYNLELYGKFGKNLKIWHGNIIINGNAIIGNNVQLHGNNCIGENGGKAPIIGNNVEIGYGATIIGDVTIADNIIIGANSLVNKSFTEKGVTIAGCPARVIKKK